MSEEKQDLSWLLSGLPEMKEEALEESQKHFQNRATKEQMKSQHSGDQRPSEEASSKQILVSSELYNREVPP